MEDFRKIKQKILRAKNKEFSQDKSLISFFDQYENRSEPLFKFLSELEAFNPESAKSLAKKISFLLLVGNAGSTAEAKLMAEEVKAMVEEAMKLPPTP